MNQGIDANTAMILTILCTACFFGLNAWRKRKEKGGAPGEITYWQDGEKHTVQTGLLKKGKKSRGKK